MKTILNLIRHVFLGSFISINFLAMTGCHASSTIVYGNYENYMSPEIMERLSHENDVKFDYYGTDNNLEANFKNNIFDVGTVSISTMVKMKQKGLLKEINWADFDLAVPGQDGSSSQRINNADDATKLFTPPVNKILQYFSKQYTDGSSLLNWGIPYFIQSFVFVYWKQPNWGFKQKSSWKEILNQIKEHYSYFNNNQLTCVEDSVTLFTLATIIHGDTNNLNLFHDESIKVTLKKYNAIFSSFTDIVNRQTFHSAQNVMLLNSDSYFSVNKIAKHEVNGGFMFNGDALFAAKGGEFAKTNPPIPGDNFFVAVPATPVTLDMIVVNKTSDQAKQKRINEVIKNIALDLRIDSVTQRPSGMTWDNFQSVMYTSPLIGIQNYLCTEIQNWVCNNQVWKNKTGQIRDNICNELKKIYTIDDDKLFYEPLLSDEEKAVLLLAFAQFKEKL